MIGTADVKEGLAASQLTALIRTDETIVRKTMCFKEFIDDVQRGGFTVGKEDPDIAGCLVDDEQVGCKSIMGVDHTIAAARWGCEVRCRGP